MIPEETSAKEHLEHVVDGFADGILILDGETRVTYANTSSVDLLGLTSELLVGHTIAEISQNVETVDGCPLLDDVITAIRTASAVECAYERSGMPLTVISITVAPITGDVSSGTVITLHDVSSARRLEAEIRDTEERFRGLFEAAFEGLVILDQGIIIDVNPAFCKLYGYAAQELIGRASLELVTEEYRVLTIDGSGSKGSGTYQAVARRRDGSTFNAEILEKTHILRGRMVRVAAVRDITERKIIEDELQREKERLEAVTSNVNSGLFLLDDQARIILANRVAEGWFGPLDQLRGQFCWQVFQLEDPETQCAAMKVLRTGEPVHSDAFMKSVNGSPKYFYVSATPMKDASGRVTNVTEVVIDITERKLIEEQLRQEKQRLQDVTLHANCGLLLLDDQARVTYANELVEKWFGPRERIMGAPCSDVFRLEDPESQCAGLKVLRTGETATGEAFSILNDGEMRYFHKIASPIKDENGKILQITEVVIDITEHVLAEEAQRSRDNAIRKAYVDVFSAVTGDKLIIATRDEVKGAQGRPLAEAFALNSYADLAPAREYLRQAFAAHGDLGHSSDDLILAASEAMSNAVKHAEGGYVRAMEGDTALQVSVTDSGGGIDFSILPKAALTAGFSTKPSLGMGFTLILELCEKVWVATGPNGTELLLESPFEASSTVDDDPFYLR